MSAAIAAAILGIMVVSYLMWVTNEYRFSKRSHAWSQAMSLAEASVELGLAQLRNYAKNPSQAFPSSDGWQVVGSTTMRRKTVNDFTDSAGNVVGDFSCTVTNIGGQYSQVIGIGTIDTINGSAISRAVSVIYRPSQESFAFFCKSFMKLTGTQTAVDSYDSTDPTKSTGGYYDPAKKQPNGNIGVLNNSGSLQLSSSGVAAIYGNVRMGNAGSFSMGSNASIGPTFDTTLRAYSLASAQSKGYVTYNLTASMPDVTLPAGLSTATLMADLSTSVTLSGGDYRVNKISYAAGDFLTITNGLVRLYVQQTTALSGTSAIIVEGGAILEVYFGGNVGLSGQGVINRTGFPKNCKLFGLPTCTDIAMSGSARTFAYLYAPEAGVRISGGGSDYNGAIQANSVTSSGSVVFHFDESIFGGGAAKVDSWQELRNVDGNWVQ